MFRTVAIAITAGALLVAACSSGTAVTETTFADAATAEADSSFVRHLQEELNFLGYHAGHVDGVWGSETADAVLAFQKDNGLETTGDYDPETARALQQAAGGTGALTIEALQQDLADLGYYDGLVDGDFGPETAAAVRAFQADHDLDQTGVMSAETVTTLVDRHNVEVEQEHIAAATASGVGGVENLPVNSKPVQDDWLKQGSTGPEVTRLKERLAALGYRPGSAGDRFDAATASAVLAFQEAEGLPRDSIVGPEVEARLEQPKAAGPKSSDPGPRVEVDLDRQIMFIIDAAGNVTTVNVSTGSGRKFQSAEEGKGIVTAHTLTGDFIVQRSIDGLREAPLGTLYRPMYFKGGWAIHGNPYVPGYPASHGCVRTSNADQDFLWTVLSDGDPVTIYGHNPDLPPDASAGA
jgi:peptidoglycan hydrolase-like protein with peptidoglycan-binding domain